MNDADRARFEMVLGDGGVSPEYLRDYYGLDWPWGDELRQDFDAWLAQSPRRTRWDDGRPSRYLIESFLRAQRLEPRKWAACRLGMDEASLIDVLRGLPRIGLRRNYEVYPRLISLSFPNDLDSHLPSMKFRTFDDHELYCEFLHRDLRLRLGVDIKELWCATSTAPQLASTSLSYPTAYAAKFDCITLKPLSVRHQILMDFGKPLYLAADACSKLLYIEERTTLQPYLAGTTEPHDLPEYEAVPHAP